MLSFYSQVTFNVYSDFGISFTSLVAKCHFIFAVVAIVMKLKLHHLGTTIFDSMTEVSRSFLEGRCIDDVNNYTCVCDPGYVGRNCDRDFDDCSSSPCNHGKAVK